jgi:hypothetical protein|tara:strand:- start:364 stop:519 length:156 start_codon:yes stop_codon:yes gene_type:complete
MKKENEPPDEVIEKYKRMVRNHNRRLLKPRSVVDGFREGWKAAKQQERGKR